MRISQRTLFFSILVGALIICISAALYIFSIQQYAASAPPPLTAPALIAITTSQPVEAAPTPLNPGEPNHSVQPAILETRRLTLEFPPKIHAGDSDILRLTLEVDHLGNITPTAVINGNVVAGDVIEIPNLYETHRVVVEARFDIAGMEVSPPELTSQTLEQGQSVTFRWSIHPTDTGTYRGTVWLYLRFVDKVSGEESRRAVSAQTVEIEAVNLFGISGGLARSVGAIGSVIGSVIGFPFFEDILQYLFKKHKRQAK